MTAAFPKFTIKEMLEAGVHFGHKEMLWNPKMDPFIYGSRNGVHIMDLQKTVAMLYKALQILKAAGSNKKSKILFVGTKRQASDAIKEAAISCNQYYVNNRWLGGMMTNWKTISRSIKKLEEMEKIIADEKDPETPSKYNKKELLDINRKRDKIESSLGGIRNMGGKPDLIFVIDTNKEKIAIKEAEMLNIPVIAIVDSNSSLDGIDFPIPGNDDASRAIRFYCRVAAEAIIAGAKSSQMTGSEDDLGSLGASLKAEELDNEGDVKKQEKSKEKQAVLKVKAENESNDEEQKDVKSAPKKESADKKESKVVAKKEAPKEKSDKKEAKPKTSAAKSKK